MEFDAAIWHLETSAGYVSGDITPRQKMLGSVVDRLVPSQDRDAIEQLLGPSLDTPYFHSLGRDLIYILGPERGFLAGVDSEWLLIWLDDASRFERYEICVD